MRAAAPSALVGGCARPAGSAALGGGQHPETIPPLSMLSGCTELVSIWPNCVEHRHCLNVAFCACEGKRKLHKFLVGAAGTAGTAPPATGAPNPPAAGPPSGTPTGGVAGSWAFTPDGSTAKNPAATIVFQFVISICPSQAAGLRAKRPNERSTISSACGHANAHSSEIGSSSYAA